MALRKSDFRKVLELLKSEDITESEAVSRFVEIAHNEVDSIKDERDEAIKGLEDYKKAHPTDEEDWKAKFEKAQKDFEDYKTEVGNKERIENLKNEYKKVLKDAKITDSAVEKILSHTDFTKIELDDKGNFKDRNALVKSVADEWSFCVVEKETQGAQTNNPTQVSHAPKTKEDIYKKDEHGHYLLNAEERQKALVELMSDK